MVWSRASRFKQLNDVDRIIGHMKLLESKRHSCQSSLLIQSQLQKLIQPMIANDT